MRIQSVTVGVPTTDLGRSTTWYQQVFELGLPDLEPVEGVVEFRVGGIWLQLCESRATGSTGGIVVRFGVADAGAERTRLASLGVEVGELQQVENVLEYFDFPDPEGNHLSIYAEVEP